MEHRNPPKINPWASIWSKVCVRIFGSGLIFGGINTFLSSCAWEQDVSLAFVDVAPLMCSRYNYSFDGGYDPSYLKVSNIHINRQLSSKYSYIYEEGLTS